MARKSKRMNGAGGADVVNTPTVSQQKSQPATPHPTFPRLRTAAYARLSAEKNDDGTIQTQISLLHRFIRDSPDLTLENTYVDNGYSGTNFDRPDFNRLMQDVYSGVIQCIVVKDLSRFGRNLIETGNYIENIFPKLDVRFIAVTDRFDSSRAEDRSSIAVPVKNMINAMYAKEFSKRQTAYFEQHSRIGDVKIRQAPYGYVRGEDGTVLFPEAETTPVVQMVFYWFISGVPICRIAERLNRLDILSPSAYKVEKGKWGRNDKDNTWKDAQIRTIITRPAYCGDRVLGRVRSALYKNIKPHRTDPSEWVIHPDTHEAIIPRPWFERAQEKLQDHSEQLKRIRHEKPDRKGRTKDCFTGKVRCLDCGNNMGYRRKYVGGDESRYYGAYYQCHWTVRRADGSEWKCRHKVHEDFVKITALDAVQTLIRNFCDMKQTVGKAKNGSNGKLGRMKRELYVLENRLWTNKERLERLYQDYAENVLTAEDYAEMKEHYISEGQEIKQVLQTVQGEILRAEKRLDSFLEWTMKLERLDGEMEDLQDDWTVRQTLFDELIESIGVGTGADGGNVAEVEFKCQNVLDDVKDILGEG
ncbi:MAG: recombinase family protein [Lachnospiraceae bacterium]|nr:recombinase family protein [Lachnospiraceae bacterium]